MKPRALAHVVAVRAVDARLVDEGTIVTAGGVTCSLDLGLYLVRRFEDDAVADKIAAQMHLPPAFAATHATQERA